METVEFPLTDGAKIIVRTSAVYCIKELKCDDGEGMTVLYVNGRQQSFCVKCHIDDVDKILGWSA